MSDLSSQSPMGVLTTGWSAAVGDYAITGAWICDGRVLVVGDSAGSVDAFDGHSGQKIWSRPEIHEGGLLALSIHPDGSSFATAGQDGRVLIWNSEDGLVLSTIEVGSGWVEHLAWSPGGRWLAASQSRRVYVYHPEAKTPEQAWRSEEHPSTVSAIAWSSAEELATACYGRVSFFEGATGKLSQKLEWKGSLVSMVMSPDGDIVACGSQDNSVHFWRRSTEEDSMMSGYPGKPLALAFDDSGTLLATGGGEAVTVWSFQGDGPEGTRPGILELHVEAISSLAFAPHGMRLASGARDGGVVVWELASDADGQAHGAAIMGDVVTGLAWHPDGQALAAFDAQGGVTVWRVSRES